MRKKPEKRTNNDNSLRKILYGNATLPGKTEQATSMYLKTKRSQK